MHQELIRRVVEELRSTLTGRFLGKLYQLTPLSFAFDFGLRGSFLYVSVEPSSPRLYLIQRRARDLQKASTQLGHFGQLFRARTNSCAVVSVDKDPLDRIVRLTFRCDDDETGATHFRRLVVQLTGRTANLFLLDELNRIVAILRGPRGQLPGEIYSAPAAPQSETREQLSLPNGSPSAYADELFAEVDTAKAFDSRAATLRSRLRTSIQRQRKLKQHLQKDIADHGDPEEHKRVGDLLLANVATAVREGNKVMLTDYYADGAPLIELDVDENTSLQDEAARRFRNYTKAKRARDEIATRLAAVDREIEQLEARAHELERVIQQRDANALENFDKSPVKTVSKTQPEANRSIPGVRRYLSTDGYEILVGRTSRDNDKLTFRIAHPNDLWMHAGDYPGSHVVIRNPTRKPIPHRTIIEAAQLAGRFSQASEDAKVVVHYTERKFLSKPKGAAPGLVRLSRFRSITVEPKEAISRL